METKKREIKMNKPIYLGLAILCIGKTLMYEFWCDYIKPKYKGKTRLCYTGTDSFIIHVETEDFYEDIADDVERLFDTSNYDQNDKRPLPLGINKKALGKFKDELGGLIMIEFIALRAKTYAYLIDGYNDEDYEKNKIINKKVKETKKCVIKRELMFGNYKESLFNNKNILKSQQRFRSDHHEVCIEEVNRLSLNSNDDKRLQTFDIVTTYPYGMNAFKVCESEMLLLEKTRT